MGTTVLSVNLMCIQINFDISKVSKLFFWHRLCQHVVNRSRPDCVRSSMQNPNRRFLLKLEIFDRAQFFEILGRDIRFGRRDAKSDVGFPFLVFTLLQGLDDFSEIRQIFVSILFELFVKLYALHLLVNQTCQRVVGILYCYY